MIYEYIKNILPDLEKIETEVRNSTMINKNIQYSRWDEDLKKLKIEFIIELSDFDKEILDEIILNN
jgi:hypothetical protein